MSDSRTHLDRGTQHNSHVTSNDGHDGRTTQLNIPAAQRSAAGEGNSSASRRGADLIAGGMSIEQATNEVGVSRQSISQSYRRLYGVTPYEAHRTARLARAAELARAGTVVVEIAREIHMDCQAIRAHLQTLGIVLPDHRFIAPTAEQLAVMKAEIEAGASYAEVAATLRASYSSVERWVKAAGLRSRATSRRDGRVQRAVARVDAGWSVGAAARRERCSDSSVRAVLAKRQGGAS